MLKWLILHMKGSVVINHFNTNCPESLIYYNFQKEYIKYNLNIPSNMNLDFFKYQNGVLNSKLYQNDLR